jgi:hypothetical protein
LKTYDYLAKTNASANAAESANGLTQRPSYSNEAISDTKQLKARLAVVEKELKALKKIDELQKEVKELQALIEEITRLSKEKK